jgi:hypothetical protein
MTQPDLSQPVELDAEVIEITKEQAGEAGSQDSDDS